MPITAKNHEFESFSPEINILLLEIVESYRVTTPTATETMLPWKREDDYDSGRPIKQNEFPAWCSNKEYLAYSSPSATFLGTIQEFLRGYFITP